MIEIAGSIHRSFIFPARRREAFNFFSDFAQAFRYLPHITLENMLSKNRFRLLFATTELGIYRIRVYCGIEATADIQNWSLHFQPDQDSIVTKSSAGLYSLTGSGFYNSVSTFREEGEQTRINYRLTIRASLPVPLGVRFMPEPVIRNITHGITQWRIDEISRGFIERSKEGYSKRRN